MLFNWRLTLRIKLLPSFESNQIHMLLILFESAHNKMKQTDKIKMHKNKRSNIMATHSLTFEENLPFFSISGGATFTTHDAPPFSSDTIISTDQTWHCHFNWQTNGPLNHLLAGTWQVKVLLEKWGPGETFLSPQQTLNFVSHPNNYNGVISVPAGAVPAGVYKPVLVITMKGPLGVPGPIAAFAEGSMMQFYDGGPLAP
ncbi:MAG: hypothetical protein DWQ10_11860 [Calditrichaeota bacterium]|nr:MAG: hypothetical protein DWQ10_11860 [Calditrichota bacterium]